MPWLAIKFLFWSYLCQFKTDFDCARSKVGSFHNCIPAYLHTCILAYMDTWKPGFLPYILPYLWILLLPQKGNSVRDSLTHHQHSTTAHSRPCCWWNGSPYQSHQDVMPCPAHSLSYPGACAPSLGGGRSFNLGPTWTHSLKPNFNQSLWLRFLALKCVFV